MNDPRCESARCVGPAIGASRRWSRAHRAAWFGLGITVVACTSPSSSAGGSAASETPRPIGSPASEGALRPGEGVVHVGDPSHPGIWLSTRSGRLPVADRRDDPLSFFDGRRVRFTRIESAATGPAAHASIGQVELVEPTREDLYRAIGAPTIVCGRKVTDVHPEGTKLAGETIRRFVVAGSGKTHGYRSAVRPGDDGTYVVTLRHLHLHEGYAPAEPVAMEMPVDPVWIDTWRRVDACPR